MIQTDQSETSIGLADQSETSRRLADQSETNMRLTDQSETSNILSDQLEPSITLTDQSQAGTMVQKISARRQQDRSERGAGLAGEPWYQEVIELRKQANDYKVWHHM